MTKRFYGCNPSKPHNAKKYSLYHTALITLPRKIDLRPKDCPIFDQSTLGSCTGNGLAGALGFLNPGNIFSRLFIYFNERKMEGTITQDAGGEIHDGIQTLVQYGCCLETIWPYDISKFALTPTALAYQQALSNVITDYFQLETNDDIKNCLCAGFPVVFGAPVFESFESEDVASSGMVPNPNSFDDQVGGHCMEIVGYDDDLQCFIVRNSWGTGWGLAGYCYIPYAYIEQYANDKWTIRSDSFSKGQVHA